MYFAINSIFDFKYFEKALENYCLVKLNQYTLNNARNGKLIVFSLFHRLRQRSTLTARIADPGIVKYIYWHMYHCHGNTAVQIS